MKLAQIVAVFAAGTLSLAAKAEEKYTLKLKDEVAVGKSVTVKTSGHDAGGWRILDAEGKVLKTIGETKHTSDYTLTVHSRDKANETWSRAYDTANKTEDGKTRALSYQKRTVVLEKKDGVTRVGVVGKPALATEDLNKLIDKANDKIATTAEWNRAILPPGPVAVGATWDVDPIIAAKTPADFDVERKGAKGTATLKKVYMRDGTRFAVIQLDLKLGMRRFVGITCEPPLAAEISVTLDTAIDGTSTAQVTTATIKAKGNGSFDRDGTKFRVEISLDATDRDEWSAEKDAEEKKAPVAELAGPWKPWDKFTSEEGKFSASFPSRPDVQSQGKATIVTSRAGLGKSEVYEVMTAEQPAKGEPLEVLALFLTGAFPKEEKNKVEIEKNGRKGYELAIERPGPTDKTKTLGKVRVFYVSGRVYMLVATRPEGIAGPDNRDKFLDSFAIPRMRD